MRNALLEQAVSLLHDACTDLLETSADSMCVALAWLRNVNAGRLQLPWSDHEDSRLQSIATLKDARKRLSTALDAFRVEKRCVTLRGRNNLLTRARKARCSSSISFSPRSKHAAPLPVSDVRLPVPADRVCDGSLPIREHLRNA